MSFCRVGVHAARSLSKEMNRQKTNSRRHKNLHAHMHSHSQPGQASQPASQGRPSYCMGGGHAGRAAASSCAPSSERRSYFRFQKRPRGPILQIFSLMPFLRLALLLLSLPNNVWLDLLLQDLIYCCRIGCNGFRPRMLYRHLHSFTQLSST